MGGRTLATAPRLPLGPWLTEGFVMARLVAVRAAPVQLPALLDQVWAHGDAILPLPPDEPAAIRESLLAVLRPSALVDTVAGHTGSATGGAGPEETPLPDGAEVPDGTALVVPTSGSTGPPKGVMLSHGALRHATAASIARLGCRPGDRWLLCLPAHHVAGLQVLARSRALGAPALFAPAGDAAAIVAAAVAAAAEGATVHVSLVPTQLARMVEAGADLSIFATVLLGGASAPTDLLDRARERGARVVISYGMTETCGGCVYDGRPLDGVEVEVAGDGRIRIRGPVLCDGYRNDPAPVTDVDGWFTTADVGVWGPDGRLFVQGRADDVIVSGGENVPVLRVEEVLRRHVGVADVAVTGCPDPEWGQIVAAVVVPADPAAPPSLTELRAWTRSQLPAAFAPQRLRVVGRLPRTDLGKVPREVIDALLREAQGG